MICIVRFRGQSKKSENTWGMIPKVKPEGANWNQKSTQSEPKGDQNASQKQDRTNIPIKLINQYFWKNLVDFRSRFGAYLILKESQIDNFSNKININCS